jgi:FkbH-like protein
MDLIDALELVKQPCAEDAPTLVVSLACSFTPLHLRTFLNARLRQSYPNHRIEIRTGLFGDLQGNLERLLDSESDAVVVVIEWQDIDLRLGIRNLGGWRSADLADILQSAERRVVSLAQTLRNLSQRAPCICSLPTQPLPPLFPQRPNQSGVLELRLRQVVASLGVSISQLAGLRVASAQELDEISPFRDRFDIRSEMMSGFPYKLPHAEALAGVLAGLIRNPQPKKGLITDLDDTLWAGILGEVEVDHIRWDLDGGLGHGLYQQFLASLAGQGVLIAVASKNDALLVERAFERKDLLLRKGNIFPFEVHWSSKSESIQRILKVWNIGPEAAVFVDDSPMEVAEVKAAFPELECRVFPSTDARALWNLLKELRTLFGKSVSSEEDDLRLESIRGSAAPHELRLERAESQDDFLKSAGAVVTIDCGRSWDGRAFELINKTNQFNLNGRRISESECAKYLRADNSFLVTVRYDDKYGSLGKIIALLGKREGQALFIDFWVMSCRAFSCRIEHQCLKYLFDKFNAQEIAFDYRTTERNGPLQEFFKQITGSAPSLPLSLTRVASLKQLPALFHGIKEAIHD